MNLERAKEILLSPQKFTVHYRGEPVWIEMVDETAEKVRIHAEDDPNDIKIIPVYDLEEQPQLH
ncbi:MAG: H-type small acid-soluble spore protein [Thermoactinomyces sp.]